MGRMSQAEAKRPQTPGEELANTISHGVGILLAVAGAVPLLVRAARTGSVRDVVGMSLYAVSLITLYAASTIYHGVRKPELKQNLRIMDHCSIFLLILGTYIPLALLTLGGTLGWVLIGINTALAVLGITLKVVDINRFSRASLVLYALMGWLVFPAIKTVVSVLPLAGVMLLVSGGVAYTAGILFYRSRKRYMHFIWHLFVLLGSILQYFCVLNYCL